MDQDDAYDVGLIKCPFFDPGPLLSKHVLEYVQRGYSAHNSVFVSKIQFSSIKSTLIGFILLLLRKWHVYTCKK